MPSRRFPLILVCLLLWCAVARADEPVIPPACPVPTEEPNAHVTYGDFSLDAQTIRIDIAKNELAADGDVTLAGRDGVFTADSARYNTTTGAGYLDRVRGCFEPFRFAAQSMSIDTTRTKQIQRAHLTTCALEHPHYELVAKDFVVQGDGRFRARHTGIAVAGHRLFSIPVIRGKVGGHSAEISKPALTGGVSRLDGTYLAMNYDYPVDDESNFSITGRTGTQGIFRGSAAYEQPLRMGKHLDDGTIALHVTWKEDVENRLIASDKLVDDRLKALTISRLPALQVAFPTLPLLGSAEGFTLRLGGGFGRYREHPTNVTANRAQAWTVIGSPTVPVSGNLRLHGELGLRGAFYSDQHHSTSVLQLTLESPPEKERYVNVTYLRRREDGTTPFLFDRVLMPDELYTEVEFPLTKDSSWWLNLSNRLDLETITSRDFTITAIYKLDCISYGLTYNRAAESIGVGLVLNTFGSFHKGVGSIGFTQ
jgi:hypothetical protein